MSNFRRPVRFEELEHTADAAIRVRGDDARETLAHLVLAYGELISAGVVPEAAHTIRIRVEPDDRAAMAIDVLRELLFEFDCHGWVPISCEIERFDEDSGCNVAVEVGRLDPEQQGDGLVLKAVTFHGARFEREGNRWLAEVVFDV